MWWGPTSSAQRALTSKRARLTQLGWRHTVLAPGAQGPGAQGPGGIDCGGVRWPIADETRWVLRRRPVQRLIEQAQPDIVESADPFVPAWAVLAATQRLGVPAVAFCHSDLPAMAAQLVGGRLGLATRRGL